MLQPFATAREHVMCVCGEANDCLKLGKDECKEKRIDSHHLLNE
jgi:hypothetical protein